MAAPRRAAPAVRLVALVIRIARGLELPPDVVTQAIAILARRGAGKTYTASVLVEEIVKAKLPVVVLDPTGAWWGLRSSRSGDKPGLPVTILGGEHGDVPLEPTAGKVIADLVIDHPNAYVLDLSGFDSRAAEQRFAADFLERLYRGKAGAGQRAALMVVVDEADLLAPQKPGGEQLRTLGALEAIVRRGRIRGLGVVLITQRAAVLNKNVLTQCEVLIALQTTGPQDRAAIDDWLKDAAAPSERQLIASTLPSLEQGEAWLWSPSWLRKLERIRIRERETWDSSRTPGAGEALTGPRSYARVDLEALGGQIAASVEQAKANDPAVLRARIAELEGKLRGTEAALKAELGKPARVETREVEVIRFDAEVAARIRAATDAIRAQLDEAAAATPRSAPVIPAPADSRSGSRPGAVVRIGEPDRGRSEAPPREVVPRTRGTEPATMRDPAPAGGASLGKGERAILGALAQYPDGRTMSQLAILTGYSGNGGRYRNLLGALRSAGLVTGARDNIAITAEGLAAIDGQWEPLPTGAALRQSWAGRLGRGEATILEALAEVYPAPMTATDLAAATGYEATGGRFRNLLGKLRTLELIDRGDPRLADALA